MHSFKLRDEINILFKKANDLLFEKLKLPVLTSLKPRYLGNEVDLRIFSENIKDWQTRLDGSFHLPIVDEIVKQFKKSNVDLTTIGDRRVSEKIILPGRFKRVYVTEEYGVPFLSSGDILQFNPAQIKYLSPTYHGRRIREQLSLHENMILVSCSGTIGNVVLTPKHFEGWTASQHVLRIVPSKKINPGYVYAFLASSYGKELVKRWTYGSVVDEIDDKQLAAVEFPLLSKTIRDEIGNLILEANKKWTEAYELEKATVSEVERNILSNQVTSVLD
jgi:type I restriction enzyme S subunit